MGMAPLRQRSVAGGGAPSTAGAGARALMLLLWLLVHLSASESPAAAASRGNSNCWAGHFNYDFCCNASFPEGNPDCWDARRYTYRRCCLTTDEPLPPLHPLNPRASKRWRLACAQDLGGWMVHELVFYVDANCSQRAKRQLRPLESGHRKGFSASNAFDQWVRATDEYFWYSQEAGPDDAWLGAAFLRPVEVQCVGLWHNNLPQLPVALQRWNESDQSWAVVQRWTAARGGEWAMLKVDAPVPSQPADPLQQQPAPLQTVVEL